MAFKDWLADMLVEKNMTQADLAKETKLSTGLISQWLKGDKKPGVASIGKVAGALHVTDMAVLQAIEGQTVEPYAGLDDKSLQLISRLFGLPPDFEPGEVELVRDLVFVIRRWQMKMDEREEILAARRRGPKGNVPRDREAF